MLKFDMAGGLEARVSGSRALRAQFSNNKLDYVSSDSTPNELRQIAAKLLELNGGNTLQFLEQDDGVINVRDERGDAVGDLVKHNGRFHISFLHTNDNADYLYQIADKLKQLNSDLDS